MRHLTSILGIHTRRSSHLNNPEAAEPSRWVVSQEGSRAHKLSHCLAMRKTGTSPKGSNPSAGAPKLACPHRYLSLALLWGATQSGAWAQSLSGLELLPDEHLQSVFAGEGRSISLRWRNSGEHPVTAEVRARVFQTGSSTAAPAGETPWKKLTVLPGQTVLETAALGFPPVRAESRFVVHWMMETNRVLGRTVVLVYPPDLLAELKPLLGDTTPGVFDPMNQLKPLLKKVSIEVSDLQNVGLDRFDGKLAIIGPFASKSQMREGFPASVKALARKGAAVVWIQPPPEKRPRLKPSYYPVREGTNAVVIVQNALLKHLAERPEPQLALIELCRLALSPEPLRLPDTDSELTLK